MRLIDADKLCEGRVSNDPVVIAAKCEPTADVQEVKHGKWNYIPETFYTVAAYECSVCKTYQLNPHTVVDFQYCPRCGAKMDLEREEL